MAAVNLVSPGWGAWSHLSSPVGHYAIGVGLLLAGLVFLGIMSWKIKEKKDDDDGFANLGSGPPEGGAPPNRTGFTDPSRLLLRSLNSDDPTVRANAARTLGEIKDPQGVEALIQALKDPHRKVRFWAAWALGVIRDPRGVPHLVAALQDADEGVRYRAAEALGEVKDISAVEALKAALGDSGEGVCQVAAWALKQITAPQPAVPPLEGLEAEPVRLSQPPHAGPVGQRDATGPGPFSPAAAAEPLLAPTPEAPRPWRRSPRRRPPRPLPPSLVGWGQGSRPRLRRSTLPWSCQQRRRRPRRNWGHPRRPPALPLLGRQRASERFGVGGGGVLDPENS